MKHENFRRVQARCKKNKDEHIRFEERFAARVYEFAERLPLIKSAADRMAYEGYLKPLPGFKGPLLVISIGPEYGKVDQDGTWNAILINRHSRVDKEEEPKMEAKSDAMTNTGTNHTNEASTEKEKSPYAVKKIVGHENIPTGIYITVR